MLPAPPVAAIWFWTAPTVSIKLPTLSLSEKLKLERLIPLSVKTLCKLSVLLEAFNPNDLVCSINFSVKALLTSSPDKPDKSPDFTLSYISDLKNLADCSDCKLTSLNNFVIFSSLVFW